MKQTVNERVRLLRTSLRLNQVDFANALKISPSLISKIERGDELSMATLDSIIKTFHVPEEWLVTGIGTMSYKEPEPEVQFNPASDILYNEMKDQILFMRETIKSLTGQVEFLREMLRAKSFRKAINQPTLRKRRGLVAKMI